MKHTLLYITMLAAVAGCCTKPKGESNQDKKEHFDNAELFSKGCLKNDMKKGYAGEMECLDANKDGCVSRAEWEKFMKFWNANTPVDGMSMCEQMKKAGWK